jgi:hypothetical protein
MAEKIMNQAAYAYAKYFPGEDDSLFVGGVLSCMEDPIDPSDTLEDTIEAHLENELEERQEENDRLRSKFPPEAGEEER